MKKLSHSTLHWLADLFFVIIAVWLRTKNMLDWQMVTILVLVFGAITVGKVQSIRAGINGVDIEGKSDDKNSNGGIK
jgi:hypothetical protein